MLFGSWWLWFKTVHSRLMGFQIPASSATILFYFLFAEAPYRIAMCFLTRSFWQCKAHKIILKFHMSYINRKFNIVNGMLILNSIFFVKHYERYSKILNLSFL
jgi:hypothetical protein